MLKRWLGKIFGFDDEIQELRRRIREFSWDSSFGMWTRNAFLQFCHVMPRDVRWIAFLDMNKIHELNEELGYTEVDRRIKETFSVSFRRSDVVARWYSGDEIVILFDADEEGAGRKIEQLVESAAEQGMTFYAELGQWEVGMITIEYTVEELGEKVAKQKREAAR